MALQTTPPLGVVLNYINMTDHSDTSTQILSTNIDATTSRFENTEAKNLRRLIYYILHGIVGLLTVLFNGVVIYAYGRSEKVRQKITVVMMNMFVFCLIHGFIVGIVYPLQRVYRYSMGDTWCIITTLLMDFADNYILVLLPVLAIERLITVIYPHMSRRKHLLYSVVSIVTALLVTVCYAWLPLIPALDIPMADKITHQNQGECEDTPVFFHSPCLSMYHVYTENYSSGDKFNTFATF